MTMIKKIIGTERKKKKHGESEKIKKYIQDEEDEKGQKKREKKNKNDW